VAEHRGDRSERRAHADDRRCVDHPVGSPGDADLHKQALLGHDLLVNCVVTHPPAAPFVEQADLDHERRLRVLADVTMRRH
jgi:hypothetical protein